MMKCTNKSALRRGAFKPAAVGSLLLLVGAGYLATDLRAQASRASSGIPNLSGIYKPASRELVRKLPNKPAVYTARALALDKAFEDQLSPMYDCQPATAPFILRDPYNFQIVQQADRALLKYEKDDVVRTVWLDGHGHPPPAGNDYTIEGHSTGRYEGDRLVVVTTKFAWNPVGLADNGGGPEEPVNIPSSALKKVTERYWREGNLLKVDVTSEDPLILREPYKFTYAWEVTDAKALVPYGCIPEEARYPAQFQRKKYQDPPTTNSRGR
jgi:hypothetical protein